MPDGFFTRDLIIILLTAFIGGTVFKKLKLPTLLGYLVGGIVISTFFSKFISSGNTIGSIAEIGVALLLFTIGLEFSMSKLKSLGDVIIFGSLVQVFFCILLFILIFTFSGFDFYSSLFLSCVFSLSSTALVLKTLSDKGGLETLSGEISSGWLFMQDIYTLPIIILLPTVSFLTKDGGLGFAPVLTFAKSLVIALLSFFLIIIVGKNIIPKLIEKIADFKSRELLLIGTVGICLFFAYIFQYLGLSFALGAFIAGILLSSSSANHGIFAEIRPLRDLFSCVFFVSLGFMVNPSFVVSHLGLILFFSFLIIFIKFAVSVILVIVLGYHTKTALMVGFSLVSVGEFAFILAMLGLNTNLITTDLYMTILSVTFISLLVSIPCLTGGEKLYYWIKRVFTSNSFGRKIFTHLDKSGDTNGEVLKDHIVVLGHGRVGKYICQVLYLAEIPFVVVDYNHKLVRNLRKQGVRVIYGDPAEIDVLHFAQVKEARIVILAYADRHTQETVVANILTLNPKVKLIARTHFEEDRTILKSLGVDSVVQPEFEAAIAMTEDLLEMMNVDKTEIESKLKNLKRQYRLNT